MRAVDELIDSAMKVIHLGYCHGAHVMAPLFSGGHDSLVACHLASQHPRFTRDVHHIRTGIGARYTFEFVQRVCEKQGWNLKIHQSPATYERFVTKIGFPGPGSHQWVYNWLKDRCVGQIAKGGRSKTLLLTGCRQQESVRRMGHVEPVKIGEWSMKKCKACKAAKRRLGDCPWGKCERVRVKLNRIWCAPCHDWSKAEQALYMNEMGLPTNKLKVALGMSGECFCGAFAQPGELDRIRQFAPDVAEEIERLAALAKAAGTPCQWGTRPQRGRIQVAETGPMCSSCDQRAEACGLVVLEN